ncbi:hypothetical protein FLAG1_05439 [Fusarium langsethiae]|uniref:Uncharacterized protein n=1 Tax=Fusarium langsethiae TaxID=179993 RepID=A0A0M9EXB9_FUSLA|nr:hypothetical protein FLAG1_05439 [Fusarium langsethiae]
MASEEPSLFVSSPKRPRRPFTPSATAIGPQLIEATYIMTRESAMAHAGAIVDTLGHRGRGWLYAIRDADEDLMEYKFTSSIEEPAATMPESIQTRLEEDLHNFKKELLHEHREATAKMMARMDSLQPPDQTSTAASPAKRRRVSTRSPSKNAAMDNLQKIDEGLCHLLGDDSELVQCFRDYAAGVDPNFSDVRSKSNGKAFWSKGQLENFRKEARELGLGVLEYKLLDRTIQEMDDGGLSMVNVAALSRQLASREQYKNLDAKFPFPFVCDKE